MTTSDFDAEASRAFLAANGTAVRKAAGSVLFHEGSTGDTVSLVTAGRIKVVLSTPTGKELVLAVKQQGEFVGELAAIDERPRSATAIAMDDCELIQLSGRQFIEFLEVEPRIAIDLLRRLATQVRLADERTADRNSADTVTRVARRLSQLHDTLGQHDRRRQRVTLLLSQEDLAGWIGASREATSRSLADLRRAGCLETGRQRIHITDIDRLRSFS